MQQHIRNVSYLVRGYDEAITFFTTKLSFSLVSNFDLGEGKRWVQLQPKHIEDQKTNAVAEDSLTLNLALSLAETPAQQQAVGKQAGDGVFMILQTDDFYRDYKTMKDAGVKFKEPPRIESYGTVAMFVDLYGNLWDLLKPS